MFEIVPDTDESKQLQGNTRLLYLVMISLFSGFPANGGELSGWKSLLMHAWEVSSKFLVRSFNTFIDQDCEVKRKERNDAGVNIPLLKL